MGAGDLRLVSRSLKGKTMSEYEDGLREGRLKSLEKSVTELSTDVSKLKVAIWMLYGAIALVSFLPDLKEFLSGAP